MVITRVHSHKTELNDRTLWFDGDSTISADQLTSLLSILSGDTSGLFVDEITDDIKQFNVLVSSDQQIKIKDDITKLDTTWNIPQEYLDLNLATYFVDRFEDEYQLDGDHSEQYWKTRATRISDEIKLYKGLKLENVLRTIIYIINTLDSKKVVWGVGRGSSVSSYLLYLIGVHNVDSVEHELDITDFLRI